MSNEVKDQMVRDYKLRFRSSPNKAVLEMLDQFEGFELVPMVTAPIEAWAEYKKKLGKFCDKGQINEHIEDQELIWKEFRRRIRKMLRTEKF